MIGKFKDAFALLSQKDADITSLKVALHKANVERPSTGEVFRAKNDVLKAKITASEAKVEDLTQYLLKNHAAEIELMTLFLH